MTKRKLAASAALIVVLLLAGCARTVTGTALPEGSGGASANPEFAKLLEECEVVSMDTIAEVVEADSIISTFFGAICRFQAQSATGIFDVTLAWFETGSLFRERSAVERLGYSVSNATVAGQAAILVTIPHQPGACGVMTRASDSGVIGWWVQKEGSGVNECDAATELTELTVRASF